MTATDVLRTLGAKLDEREPLIRTYDAYYRGEVSLGVGLAPEVATALAGRIKSISVNIVRLSVESLVERLRVTGFHRGDAHDPELGRIWRRNDLDQLAPVAHREALLTGSAYVIVWAGPDKATPLITIESPHQVAVARDPATRRITAALKRWTVTSPETGAPTSQNAVVYEADSITRLTTDSPDAPALSGAWRVVQVLDNPLGVPPIVELGNVSRVVEDPRSDVADLLPLADAYSKILLDLMITSEYYARPRRFVTGVEVPVDDEGKALNPFDQSGQRTWIAEPSDARIGQLAGSDLSAYQSGTETILRAISASTSLPGAYLGLTVDNASADAVRAAEAGLTARAEARQRSFGRGWEDVARLAVAARDGVDPRAVDVTVKWADPSTRSEAQAADAAAKLVDAGIVTVAEARERLGYLDAPATTPAPTTGDPQ